MIAEHLGCNPQYLSRVYQKPSGQTLTTTIHRKRVTQACHLLLNSEMRVGEIARSCGMEDVSYFLQLFKRQQRHDCDGLHAGCMPAILSEHGINKQPDLDRSGCSSEPKPAAQRTDATFF